MQSYLTEIRVATVFRADPIPIPRVRRLPHLSSEAGMTPLIRIAPTAGTDHRRFVSCVRPNGCRDRKKTLARVSQAYIAQTATATADGYRSDRLRLVRHDH